jgi:hypothetical protein
MYRFPRATLDHVDAFVRDMDPLIKKELHLFSDRPIRETTEKTVTEAEEAWVAEDDDGPICLFSIRRPFLLSDIGIASLITTHRVHRHKRDFLRGAKLTIKTWKHRYPIIMSYVPQGTPKLVRWAEWLGFEIFPAERLGPKDNLIHKIEMR